MATMVALSIGAVLAVFATAAVVILALMTSATLAFAALAARAAVPGAGSPFAEISDADIDNLFSE
jgi:hypothetical protein